MERSNLCALIRCARINCNIKLLDFSEIVSCVLKCMLYVYKYYVRDTWDMFNLINI